MFNILVTGSLGFIGDGFIRNLFSKRYKEKRDDSVCYKAAGIDNIVKPYLNLMPYKGNGNGNYTPGIGDVRDPIVLQKVFEFFTPNVVLHLAEPSKDLFIDGDPSAIVDQYKALESALVVSERNHAKFIYISDCGQEGKETAYLACKRYAEEKIKELSSDYLILRVRDLYGQRQSTKYLIPSIIKKIRKEESIVLSENHTRYWTHIDDLSDAIRFCLSNSIKNVDLNISSKSEISDMELVQKLFKMLNREFSISFEKDVITEIRFCDTSLINNLGWEASIRFMDGLKDCAAWYNVNGWWLEKA